MTQSALFVTLAAFAALIAAYFIYGRFLARRIFRLDASRPTPAHQFEDGVDYVPTKVPVLFGHHFASIAGLGPILGPAIAVIWGWLPAVLWVVIGSMFLGAVHDLGALTVSLRFRGRSIGDVCRDLVGPRARLLFLVIIFFLMSLAMGAFVSSISALFVNYRPDAIIPSFGLMIVAMGMGIAVYRLKVGLGPATTVSLIAFAALIYTGVRQPVLTYAWFADADTLQTIEQHIADDTVASPYGAAAMTSQLESSADDNAAEALTSAAATARLSWVWLLLAYAFVASVLPVWLLLQPRDYINSFQLYAALALLVIGLGIATMTSAPEATIDAAPVRDVADAPPMFPFLLVTIACGAVSGFHSLVSSGTTVRQLNRETDALPIGFGAMLTEGALAILIIMACVAGLGATAWDTGVYASWSQGIQGSGLDAQLSAVVRGGGNFLTQVGIPTAFAQAFLAVTIVAFAMTTLDSATRLLRFNVEEILRSIGLAAFANRYIASFAAVLGIAFFALVPAGKELWTLFGTTNQLLAGLTLLTVTVFLFKLGRPIVFTLIPMGLMLVVSIWAMLYSLRGFWNDEKWSLVGVSSFVLALTIWLVIEAVASFGRGRGIDGFDEDGHLTGHAESPSDSTSEPAATA